VVSVFQPEPLFAVKGEEHQTEGIQPAHEDPAQREDVGEHVSRRMRQVQRLDDRILGEEPANGGMPALASAPISTVQ
jgi:hypothetical protein